MEESSRTKADRLLGISETLLEGRDFSRSREFAILAQEADPLLDGTDQILAVADVMLASEKRINNHHDWYAILQLERRSDDMDLIRKQYRRLALLLHPDKNKLFFADVAFRLVADSWSVLSDSTKKSLYDNELGMFAKVDFAAASQHQQKLPVRRGSSSGGGGGGSYEEDTSPSFWTVCPYCYNLYEYARVYEDCCLRCQNCQKAFHGVMIPTLPPLVAGKEAYHCCWSFFPSPSVLANANGAKKAAPTASVNRTPPAFWSSPAESSGGGGSDDHAADGFIDFSEGNARKRGRPRKNAVQQPW